MHLSRQCAVLLCSIHISCLLQPSAAQHSVLLDTVVEQRIETSPTLGLEEQRFPLQDLPAGAVVGAVSGVALAQDGSVYVVQRGVLADPILVFDAHGRLLRSWGKGDFVLPHSLRLDAQGNVWAIDAGSSFVIKYSPLGRRLLTIDVGQVPNTEGPFRGPTDVAFSKSGDVFITDGYGNARVLEYTPDGHKIREWGRAGIGAGEFHLPHAVQVDADGTVYVADRENGRIQKFSERGRFLGEIDHLGRCYALKLINGFLWASMSPMAKEPGAPGWLVKLDPQSGNILGHFDIPDERMGHAIDVSLSGKLILTVGNGLIELHRR